LATHIIGPAQEGPGISRCAVIGEFEGQRALIVRAVWKRSYALLDATAQLAWLESVTISPGRTIHRFRELELVRNHYPMMGLAWTLIHILPEDSDIIEMVESSKPFLLTASVAGTDMLLNSPSQSLQRYWRGDVHPNHEFGQMVFREEDDLRLDFTQFDVIKPIADARHGSVTHP
jgi:inward rectifier potassium channel